MDSGDPTKTLEQTNDLEDEDTGSPYGDYPAPRLGAGNRYVLGEALGRGGMGEVLAARDEQLGRDVAIKRMLRSDASDRAMVRFFREASIQGRLDHPSIV